MQFMVDMACQSCVSKVKASLQGVQGALLLQLGGSLRPVDASRAGISTVSADLSTQTVLVEGAATVDALLSALTTSGMNARLVGQGSVTGAGSRDGHSLAPPSADRRTGAPAGFGEELARSLGLDLRTLRQSLAAVSEFKGDAWGQGDVVGVVRFVQVNRALCRVEAALDGLTPGKHLLAVHTFGACLRALEPSLGGCSRHALYSQAT